MATFVAMVWGSTLISSKILIQNGLSPLHIMFIRFVLAWILLWIMYPKYHKIRSLKSEFSFFLMGFTGCTLYFISENTALIYTSADNVGLISATVPLITAFATKLVFKDTKVSKFFYLGSILAFLGVAIVVLNGKFMLNLNPLGDFLTLLAMIFWAIFCIMQKLNKENLPSLYVTRKIFFYGLVTMSLLLFFIPFEVGFETLKKKEVFCNLLFLGFIASGICYWFWNICLSKLGTIITNNYIYALPIVTIIVSSIFLEEKITIFTILGSILIIGGLLLSRK